MRRRVLLSGGAALGAAALGGGALRARAETPPPGRVIAIVARKYVFIPNEITVQVGEPVVLELTAAEVTMGFYAPALGLRTIVVPGEPARVPWTPDRPGRFDFLCDVFCGDGHEGMNGHLLVT